MMQQQKLEKSTSTVHFLHRGPFVKKTMTSLLRRGALFLMLFTSHHSGVQGQIDCTPIVDQNVCKADNTFLCDSTDDNCSGGSCLNIQEFTGVRGTSSMCQRPASATTMDPICNFLDVFFDDTDSNPQGMICDGKQACGGVIVYFGDQTKQGTVTCKGPESCTFMDVYFPTDDVKGQVTCKGGSFGAPACADVNVFGGCLVCEGKRDCYDVCAFDADSLYFECYQDQFFQGSIGSACTEDQRTKKSALPACFSGVNTVEVQDQGVVTLDSLKIGDYVKTGFSQDGQPKFSPVLSFMHMDPYSIIHFFQIFTNAAPDLPLEISDDHFLYLSNGKVVKAKNIQIGDILKGPNSNMIVTNIELIQRQGMYAPVTENGQIFVSGVLASSYSSMLNDEIVSANMQVWLSHMALAPLRLVWNNVCFSMCKNESYSEDRYSTNLSSLIQFGVHFSALTSGMQTFLLIVITPFLWILAGLEMFFHHHDGWMRMVSLLTIVPTFMYHKISK